MLLLCHQFVLKVSKKPEEKHQRLFENLIVALLGETTIPGSKVWGLDFEPQIKKITTSSQAWNFFKSFTIGLQA